MNALNCAPGSLVFRLSVRNLAAKSFLDSHGIPITLGPEDATIITTTVVMAMKICLYIF